MEGGGSDSSFRKGKRTSYVTFDGKKEKLLQKNHQLFILCDYQDYDDDMDKAIMIIVRFMDKDDLV